MLKYYGFEINKKLIRELTAKRGLPFFKMQYAETAIRFLLNGELITEEQKAEIVAVLKNHSVYEKKKVTLDLNERLKRTLISSVGKLESIKRIADNEVSAMGERLRMLILTDYIKKENLRRFRTSSSWIEFPSRLLTTPNISFITRLSSLFL